MTGGDVGLERADWDDAGLDDPGLTVLKKEVIGLLFALSHDGMLEEAHNSIKAG